jgi:pyruvate,water dikinase
MTERAQMPPINPPTSGREPAEVIALADIDPTMIDLVGGKSLGLARMIIAGERVPDGFCVTTRAHSVGVVPRDRVLQAYHHQLGGGPVAVRSSATAEDLADASFAGQQDSYLNVAGDQELINAIERCWASLDNDRAVAYRRDRGWDGQQVAMAVVVQRMVRPRAAGVLFTANPITGTRTEMIIDAVAGLGDVVVDGSAETDHYVLSGDQPVEPHGCLSAADLDQLRSTGRRLEHEFGQPQDIEWAIDDDGLWLLQSRAITTLFPVPAEVAEDDLRVYLEVGHLQGFRRPVTPMGMSVLVKTTQISFEQLGISTRDDLIKDIAGRMFVDLTPFLRNPRLRGRVVGAMDVYGPGIKRSLQRLIDDPRLAPRPGKAFDVSAMIKVLAGALPKQAVGMISTFLVPAAARRRAFRTRDRVRRWPAAPDNLDAAKRIEYAIDAIGPIIGDAMMALIPPLWVGLGSRGVADALFSGIAEPGELDSIGRGMPYNVTTEMDLRLWSVSEAAAEHRELFLNTPPEELARRYLRGELPKIGLEDFLDAYGRRSALEIDVGVPRWEEDPTPVFSAMAGYLRLTDRDAAPDVRFERAAVEAEEALDRLVGRASRTRPLRAMVGGVLLRRWRALAGLRELPKFVWIVALRDIRRQLLLAGAELAGSGRLERADDIMFLTLAEAEEGVAGTDQSQLAATRRADYEREFRRQQVPGLLLSDGTMPEALPDPDAIPAEEDDLRMVGMPAAAGRATGTVRVVHDPTTARIEPGDILVAPTTDPGWTPLFLTLGGLITETGSPIAHGPTVAREYGIPAVICVRDATTRLKTGQMVTIDGASGVVIIEDEQPT